MSARLSFVCVRAVRGASCRSKRGFALICFTTARAENERTTDWINHACGWSGEFNLPNDDDDEDDEDDEDDDEKDDRANDGFCGWE